MAYFTGVRMTLRFSSQIGTRCLQGVHGEGLVGKRVRLSFSLVVRTAVYMRVQPKSRVEVLRTFGLIQMNLAGFDTAY